MPSGVWGRGLSRTQPLSAGMTEMAMCGGAVSLGVEGGWMDL